jgi:hypothetical protein
LKTIDQSIQESGIYLIVNNNSPVWRREAKNWPPDRVVRFFDGIANPPKDIGAGSYFVTEFNKLAQMDPKPAGLVVTNDPYFFYWRTSFVQELAKRLPIPVCYPFKDFVDVATNKSKCTSLNQPPLNSSDKNDEIAAYFQLGKQVGKFLAGTAEVGVLTWSGSEWKAAPPVVSPVLPPTLAGSKPTIEIEIRVKGRVEETMLLELLAALRSNPTASG